MRYAVVSPAAMKAVGKAWVAAVLLSALLALVLFYPVYLLHERSLDLSPGSIGSPADESVPVASSIAQMEQNTLFTIELYDWSTKSIRHKIGGKVYYTILLPNGETVAARIHADSVQRPGRGRVILPVGRWKTWKHSAKEVREYQDRPGSQYTDFDHYVDMKGDFGRQSTPVDIGFKVFEVLFLIHYFLMLWLIGRRDIRLGRCEPDIMRRRFEQTARETLPIDDTERWCLAAYAIWAESIGSCKHIGGFEKKPKHQIMMRELLARDWNISDRDSGLETVEHLTEHGRANRSDHASCAWDWCRALQLLGCCFLCSFLSREELRERSCQVGQLIQREFSGWDELCQSYLEGFARWRRSTSPHTAEQLTQRRDIHQKLVQLGEDGPYAVPFGTILISTIYSSTAFELE